MGNPDGDRELLELAAKAAGIAKPRGQGGYINNDGGFVFYLDCEGKTARTWNPLQDDGDALRLAVRLGLVLSPSTVSVMAFLPGVLSKGEVWQALGEDHLAATRRAIVRAAAEIGKAMP